MQPSMILWYDLNSNPNFTGAGALRGSFFNMFRGIIWSIFIIIWKPSCDDLLVSDLCLLANGHRSNFVSEIIQSWHFAKFCPANDICTAGPGTTNIFCESDSNFEIGQTVRLNLTGLKLWVYSAPLCGGRVELSERMGKTRPPMSAKDSTRKFEQKGLQHRIERNLLMFSHLGFHQKG